MKFFRFSNEFRYQLIVRDNLIFLYHTIKSIIQYYNLISKSADCIEIPYEHFVTLHTPHINVKKQRDTKKRKKTPKKSSLWDWFLCGYKFTHWNPRKWQTSYEIYLSFFACTYKKLFEERMTIKKWMKCHPYLWLAPHLHPSLLSCLNSHADKTCSICVNIICLYYVVFDVIWYA